MKLRTKTNYGPKLRKAALGLDIKILNETKIPLFTPEQIKLIMVYQALRDCGWNRQKACASLNMVERTFAYHVHILIDAGFIKSINRQYGRNFVSHPCDGPL